MKTETLKSHLKKSGLKVFGYVKLNQNDGAYIQISKKDLNHVIKFHTDTEKIEAKIIGKNIYIN